LERAERRTLIALAAVTFILRALAYFRFRFDSDEPQHLHVAWGWSAGLVQYRDLFDNHAPLFHIVSAPLVKLAGEREDILFFMRAPMLILFGVVVYATYILGKRAWSPRVGVWAAMILCAFPPFFLKSLEYRTDNLWNTVWMLALLAIASPFLLGLLLGVALCVSLKTVLLVATIAIVRWRSLSVKTLAGFVIAPAIVSAYFFAIGAWPSLVFCVFRFNELPASRMAIALRFGYPLMLVTTIWFAKRRGANELTMMASVFTVTLIAFWSLISPRDFLPIMPLIAIAIAAHVPTRALAAIAIVFLVATAYYTEWFRNGTREYTTMLRQVIGISRPGETLMDYKGETVFRRRPYYFIFEKIGRGAMNRGALRDTIAESMIRARCYVAQADGPFWPPGYRKFLVDNYLDMGRLRAAGQWLRDDGTFTIAVPGEYVVVSERGAVGPTQQLASGAHRFAKTNGERLAVLWAPAFRRGYSPFHLRDREF
jgi:MFS family permease